MIYISEPDLFSIIMLTGFIIVIRTEYIFYQILVLVIFNQLISLPN